ncbi:MAG: ATP-binding cassette domain-containing protein, partial [Proteobacteria bacterium]|nr:ATP-binding cassette domain-containing protein [Pseudomonadota bacterium]
MNTLKSEQLVKSYKSRVVVNQVNLSVRSGEIVGLLGPNGAGKTTSFYILVGLIECDGGKVLLNEQDITYESMHERARAGISYLPQE